MKMKTLGVLVLVLFSAASVAMIAASRQSSAEARTPVQVDAVPESIPTEGVTLLPGVLDMTLMPVSADASGVTEPAISAAEAVSLGFHPEIPPSEPMTVLAIVTVGSSLPPEGDSSEGYEPIQDRLAWIVVYTYSEPFDPRLGRDRSDPDGVQPYLARHLNAVVDAETGKFLLGFYTK